MYIKKSLNEWFLDEFRFVILQTREFKEQNLGINQAEYVAFINLLQP